MTDIGGAQQQQQNGSSAPIDIPPPGRGFIPVPGSLVSAHYDESDSDSSSDSYETWIKSGNTPPQPSTPVLTRRTMLLRGRLHNTGVEDATPRYCDECERDMAEGLQRCIGRESPIGRPASTSAPAAMEQQQPSTATAMAMRDGPGWFCDECRESVLTLPCKCVL
jgi:hypothetical protein